MQLPLTTTKGIPLTRLNPATTMDLINIVKKFNIKNILEIGSYVGMGSTQIFIELCEKVTCIENFSTGRYFEIELDGQKKTFNQLDLFNQATKFSKKLKLINGSSEEVFDNIKNEEYDAVFIDGSHFYPDVLRDIKKYYFKVKKNGILIGDDCQGYLSNFKKKMIIDNLDNHNTIDIKNYKYSQIHPDP